MNLLILEVWSYLIYVSLFIVDSVYVVIVVNVLFTLDLGVHGFGPCKIDEG